MNRLDFTRSLARSFDVKEIVFKMQIHTFTQVQTHTGQKNLHFNCCCRKYNNECNNESAAFIYPPRVLFSVCFYQYVLFIHRARSWMTIMFTVYCLCVPYINSGNFFGVFLPWWGSDSRAMRKCEETKTQPYSMHIILSIFGSKKSVLLAK